jgi:anti-sigma regulatory factor (Ser/Thr protein kinase)
MSAIATAAPPSFSQLPKQWPLRYVLPAMGALPTAPRTARAHTRDVLGEWRLHQFVDDASLVVSELVTNAVQAATDATGRPLYVEGGLPLIKLSLFSNRTILLITVYDQAPGTPQQQAPNDVSEAGRGLEMIAKLGAWDCHPVPGGKVVRALLAEVIALVPDQPENAQGR